jgi:hypothetical protein
MSASDFSPGHRALPRIFANPKESQLAEITQLLFQSGSKRYHRFLVNAQTPENWRMRIYFLSKTMDSSADEHGFPPDGTGRKIGSMRRCA